MSTGSFPKQYTHYDVLRLDRDDFSSLSKDDIKAAYRRALLIHHPDKISSDAGRGPSTLKSGSENVQPKHRYSIDDIVSAYEILSDPTKRADYNRSLGRDSWKRANDRHNGGTHIGVESYDLEDLTYDEDKGTWSRSCRCGDEKGYVVTEADLERESQQGEIYVGCRGCSLFIKVQFAIEEA